MNKINFSNSNEFLNIAKKQAQKEGYNPDHLFLSDKKDKKLMYLKDNKKIYFGAKGYGDFIYYKKFEPEIADQKRNTFRKSHGKIKDSGKYSPNQLAIRILW